MKLPVVVDAVVYKLAYFF